MHVRQNVNSAKPHNAKWLVIYNQRLYIHN